MVHTVIGTMPLTTDNYRVPITIFRHYRLITKNKKEHLNLMQGWHTATKNKITCMFKAILNRRRA